MAVNDAPRVLISGAGVAGPARAYWLARHRMRPTLVEKAPGPRTGGYIIDFWGSGYEVAERMRVLPLRLFARNQASKLLGIRWIAKLAFGRSLVDRLELPRYDSPE